MLLVEWENRAGGDLTAPGGKVIMELSQHCINTLHLSKLAVVAGGKKTSYLLMASIWFEHVFLMVSIYNQLCFLAKYFSISCQTNNYRANLLRGLCQNHTWASCRADAHTEFLQEVEQGQEVLIWRFPNKKVPNLFSFNGFTSNLINVWMCIQLILGACGCQRKRS